jgi:hypothetical protein
LFPNRTITLTKSLWAASAFNECEFTIRWRTGWQHDRQVADAARPFSAIVESSSDDEIRFARRSPARRLFHGRPW